MDRDASINIHYCYYKYFVDSASYCMILFCLYMKVNIILEVNIFHKCVDFVKVTNIERKRHEVYLTVIGIVMANT